MYDMDMYEQRTLVISPPRKPGVVEYSASDQELVLQAFTAKPNLDFGTVKINTRVETSLKISNPSDVDLTVSVSKAPDQFAAATSFVVPAGNHVIFSVAWRPKEEGCVRKALNVSASPSKPPIKTGIVLIGKCVDPSKGPEWKRAAAKAVPKPKAAAAPSKKPPTGSFRARGNSTSSNVSAISTNSAAVETTKSDIKEGSKQKTDNGTAIPNLPPKKRGFFRSTQKAGVSKENGKTASKSSPAPPVVVNSNATETKTQDPKPVPTTEEVLTAGSNETFLVPETPTSKTPTKNNSNDETFLVPLTPGPRETFVVVPQASQATLTEIRRRESEQALKEEDESEKVEEMPPPNKFRFPGSLYKKRRSSTPVTSPKDRYGSLRSTNSEVIGRPVNGRSPASRFAGAVSDKLDGMVTRSKSFNLRRRSKNDIADPEESSDTREYLTLPAKSKPLDGNTLGSPNEVFERFQKKMEALKLGAGIKRSAKKPSSAFAGNSGVLGSKENKLVVPEKEVEPVRIGHSTVIEGTMDVDLPHEDHEADLSMPSTICSPEPPLEALRKENLLDDIPEESSLNDSNKENVAPVSPAGGGLMAKFNQMLASFSPRSTAKKMPFVPIGSDGTTPLHKHLAVKRLMAEASPYAIESSCQESETVESTENTVVIAPSIFAKPTKPSVVLPSVVIVSRKELAAIKIQCWWFRHQAARARAIAH